MAVVRDPFLDGALESQITKLRNEKVVFNQQNKVYRHYFVSYSMLQKKWY